MKPKRFYTPDGGAPIDGGASDTPPNADKSSGEPSYIKEMKSQTDWQNTLENRERPIMIQAGASWCGPCNTLKPMLIDAVKGHDGKLEYLYVDIDENPTIAQMLKVSSFSPLCISHSLTYLLTIPCSLAFSDPTCASRVPRS